MVVPRDTMACFDQFNVVWKYYGAHCIETVVFRCSVVYQPVRYLITMGKRYVCVRSSVLPM